MPIQPFDTCLLLLNDDTSARRY